LQEILDQPLIDPDQDEVSRLILDGVDREAFASLHSLTVGEFRELVLDDQTGEEELHGLGRAVTPEMAAAVAKLMSNKHLVLAAARVRNAPRCRNTMGERGVLGIRIQPNPPADDLGGILLSAVDGLLFGCGDAVIGVNPVTDAVETVAGILRS